MDHQTPITIEDIRELRLQLMAALDDLKEVEHRVQNAHHVCQRAGKIVETIRSWRDEEPPAPETPAKPKPSTPEKLRFLSVADLAERWGCATRTVTRLMEAGQISPTYFSARMVRYQIEEIERYERECRG